MCISEPNIAYSKYRTIAYKHTLLLLHNFLEFSVFEVSGVRIKVSFACLVYVSALRVHIHFALCLHDYILEEHVFNFVHRCGYTCDSH